MSILSAMSAVSLLMIMVGIVWTDNHTGSVCAMRTGASKRSSVDAVHGRKYARQYGYRATAD